MADRRRIGRYVEQNGGSIPGVSDTDLDLFLESGFAGEVSVADILAYNEAGTLIREIRKRIFELREPAKVAAGLLEMIRRR